MTKHQAKEILATPICVCVFLYVCRCWLCVKSIEKTVGLRSEIFSTCLLVYSGVSCRCVCIHSLAPHTHTHTWATWSSDVSVTQYKPYCICMCGLSVHFSHTSHSTLSQGSSSVTHVLSCPHLSASPLGAAKALDASVDWMAQQLSVSLLASRVPVSCHHCSDTPTCLSWDTLIYLNSWMTHLGHLDR